MLDAIFEDMVGSVYEFFPTKDYNFNLLIPYTQFVDDTEMAVVFDFLYPKKFPTFMFCPFNGVVHKCSIIYN